MKRCTKSGCKFHPWRKGLCYTHWRESQGFVFDPVQKVFVRLKRMRSA
jgi:hypothetical protein